MTGLAKAETTTETTSSSGSTADSTGTATAGLAGTADGTLPDKAEALEKIDRSLNPESYVSYKKIVNIDTKGIKKEFVMYVGKLGADKVLGSFLAPKTEVGRATLRIGDNMWLYIPNVKKPVRITSLQSVTGGLFNNSDIMGLDYSDEYDCIDIKLAEGKYELELKAKTGSVAYEKLIVVADTETYTPERIDCYTSSGMLVKSLHFKKIVEFEEGFKRPSVVETDSPLFKGAKSIMIYSQMKRVQLDESLFNINNMAKYQELR
ncbi:MAG: outer membrane lipoprotein-sorting protein [Candidatus Riflebacteria bacterium HGW-Riflebacteria-2]|nr:MAG: outer membrane lipoprotein-sorting protein [Candidatus Riflebacteria bacterium HGW-Riflebacteria-2]